MALMHENGTFKPSESEGVEVMGGGKNDPSLSKYPKLLVRVSSNNHFHTILKTLDSPAAATNRGSPKVVDASAIDECLTGSPDIDINEGDLSRVIKLCSYSSSSSSSISSSDSSLDDLFHVEGGGCLDPKLHPIVSSRTPHEGNQTENHFKYHKTSDSHNDFPRSEQESGLLGPALTSAISDITHESLVRIISPTQSPPIQIMERSEQYDPCRILSSIFSRSKSAIPLEWSVASNESLFSIHVGNNSFSRDHAFVLSDLCKSGELAKSGELFIFSPPPPILSRVIDHISSPSAMKIYGLPAENTKIQNFEETLIPDQIIESETDRIQETSIKIEEKKPPLVMSSNSNHSNDLEGNGDSTCLFSFPIRKKRCAWPSCYCSNCSWAFCYCIKPHCNFRWPSCSHPNCSWTFCYCWNRRHERWCFPSSSTILAEEMKPTEKAKMKEKQLERLPPQPPSSSKSICCSWLRYIWNGPCMLVQKGP